ncbi:MAG: diaminopimelate decarboxylase [Nanoarchaeota archaeon]|nr:diaminopimelate decarboxylase [Nanoarchaeota archaeon]
MEQRLWWEKQDLEYRNNNLFFADLDVEEFARKNGTPLFLYDTDKIKEKYSKLKETFLKYNEKSRIRFAIKALSSKEILQELKQAGCEYVDSNSIGEAQLALQARYKPENILYTETNISNESLEKALELGISINVDSISQLNRLHTIHPQALEISIRWNPGKGTGEFPEIITAGKESHGVPVKFGIPESRLGEAYELAEKYNKRIIGLHQHIGSNLQGEKDLEIFLETVDSTIEVAKTIKQKFGKIDFINFGGGIGIQYKQEDEEFPLEDYAKELSEKIKKSNLNTFTEIEPGRYLTADAGIMILEVNTIEEKNQNLFIGVNGMFPRPFYYGSYHEIIPCERTNKFEEAIVAGNYCETELDLLTTYENNGKRTYKRKLEIPNEGKHIALLCAGAYGFEMLPILYNLKKIPRRFLIKNKEIQEINFTLNK